MMAQITTIEKALACRQDLAIGLGTALQTRNGATVAVDKIGLNWLVLGVADLASLSVDYTHATITGGVAKGDFVYDEASTATDDGVTVITPTHGVGRWVVVPAAPSGGATEVYHRATVAAMVGDATIPVGGLVRTEAYAANSATKTRGACWYIKVAGSPPLPANGGSLITAGSDHYRALFEATPTVAQYGAVGDGVVDDIAAFNQAVSAERHLVVEPATYTLSTTLGISDCHVTAFDATLTGFGVYLAGTTDTVSWTGGIIEAAATSVGSVGMTVSGDNKRVDTCTIRGFETNLHISAAKAVLTDVTCGDAKNGAVGNIGTIGIWVKAPTAVTLTRCHTGGITGNGNFLNPNVAADTSLLLDGFISASRLVVQACNLFDQNGSPAKTVSVVNTTDNRGVVTFDAACVIKTGKRLFTSQSTGVMPRMVFTGCRFQGDELDVFDTRSSTASSINVMDFISCTFDVIHDISLSYWLGVMTACIINSGGARVTITSVAGSSGLISGCSLSGSLYTAGGTGGITVIGNRFTGTARVVYASASLTQTIIGNTSDSEASNALMQAVIAEKFLRVGADSTASTMKMFTGTADAAGSVVISHGIFQLKAHIIGVDAYSALNGLFTAGTASAINDTTLKVSGLIANGLYRVAIRYTNVQVAGWA